jgi:hypothetical protein
MVSLIEARWCKSSSAKRVIRFGLALKPPAPKPAAGRLLPLVRCPVMALQAVGGLDRPNRAAKHGKRPHQRRLPMH